MYTVHYFHISYTKLLLHLETICGANPWNSYKV